MWLSLPPTRPYLYGFVPDLRLEFKTILQCRADIAAVKLRHLLGLADIPLHDFKPGHLVVWREQGMRL